MSKMASLKPLVGRWSTTITVLYPSKLRNEVYHAVDNYRWLPGEQILVHEVEAKMAGTGIRSLEVFSAMRGRIVSRNYDGRGQVSDYRAAMQKGVWHIEGETERFTSTSIASDAVEGIWQLKTKGRWVDWMTVRLDRVS